MLGLLAIPSARRDLSASDGRHPHVDASAPVEATAASKHAPTSATWKLPFRLKPRLTEGQQRILSSGRVGAYLREHPQEDDLLVAWAANDPEAASAWLA